LPFVGIVMAGLVPAIPLRRALRAMVGMRGSTRARRQRGEEQAA
jgi:hypothetical protein